MFTRIVLPIRAQLYGLSGLTDAYTIMVLPSWIQIVPGCCSVERSRHSKSLSAVYRHSYVLLSGCGTDFWKLGPVTLVQISGVGLKQLPAESAPDNPL